MSLIAIRTNAGAKIGFGHLRRCLTLAETLVEHGADVRFIVNDDRGICEIVSAAAFEFVVVRSDIIGVETAAIADMWGASAVICDSYEFDDLYFETVKSEVPTVVAIDDLADRRLHVQLVVNGAANAHELTYRTGKETRLLLGCQYVLLRKEFALAGERAIHDRVDRVLITLGGSDYLQLAPHLTRWARDVLPETAIDVVIGPFFAKESVSELEKLAAGDRLVSLLFSPTNMGELMLKCDLAVTGGGQTVYELAATGTPGLALQLADNQAGNLSGLVRQNVLRSGGTAAANDLTARVAGILREIASSQVTRSRMSQNGRALVDGRGRERVAQAIIELMGQK